MDADPIPQRERLPLLVLRLSQSRRALASIVFIVSSLAAYWQFRAPYQWHESYLTGDTERWWLNPVEWNIDAGLPDIVGNINAVEVIGTRVFVAGDTGLLAFSADAGRTFTQLRYSTTTREFTAPADASSGGTAAKEQAAVEWVDPIRWLVPTLNAAAPQQPATPRQGGSPQQQAPPLASRDQIAVSDERLPFPTTVVGVRGPSQSIQFKNAGNVPVTLGEAQIRGGEGSFSIDVTDCGELVPGQSCNMFVAFAPKSAGVKNGILSIAGYSIVLAGMGEAPVGQAGPVTPTGPAQTPSATPAPNTGPQPPGQAPAQPPSLAPAPDLVALYCIGGGGCELMAKGDDLVFSSRDGGLSWQTTDSYQGTSLHGDTVAELRARGVQGMRDAAIDSAGRRAWIVASSGQLFRIDGFVDSASGGTGTLGPLVPVTRAAAATLPGHSPVLAGQQYGRFLPPWYLFVLAVCLLVSVPEGRSLRSPSDERDAIDDHEELEGPPTPAEVALKEFSADLPYGRDDLESPSIADEAVSDRPLRRRAPPPSAIGNQAIADKPLAPGEPDVLGLGTIATGLAFFLRNEKTKPPLVIAINGRWGSGKSSLMNLLKSQMETYGARPVWFNAWHHQKEDQLLAALLETVKQQAIPNLSKAAGWSFRTRLAWERLQRYWMQLAIVVAAVTLLWYVETNLSDRLSFGSAVETWLGWTDDARTKLAAERATAALEAVRRLQEVEKQTTDPIQLVRIRGAIAQQQNAATAPVTSGWFDRIFGPIESSFLALVAAIFAAFKTLSRGLRAFATNPASLLASDAGATKPRDLEAQTNFRQRFAAEFADVTRALGRNRRMLILIDDLDRCRPEKVRDVLEAVNFLVSSGDCFIVLGMARDIVEHCVGLSFRRVVDTMPWTAFELSQEEISRFLDDAKASMLGSASDARVQQAAKRRAFARLFLDKLVQIEVSIPEPTPAQRRKLFETDEERQSRHASELKVAAWLRAINALSRVGVPAAQVAVVLLVLVGGGLQAAPGIASWLERLFPDRSSPVQAATVSAITVPNPSQGATVPQQLVVSTPPVAPEIVAGISPPAGWVAAWPFYVVVFGALAVATTSLRRLPHQTVSDAKPFTNALSVWHPLVMTTGARNTPRTARRFQNRVRYLAMRQRALMVDAPLTVVERTVRRILKAPAQRPDPPVELPESGSFLPALEREVSLIAEWLRLGVEGDCSLATVKQTVEGAQITMKQHWLTADKLHALAVGNLYIPEQILVALAAIDEFDSRLINDAGRFEAIAGWKGSRITLTPALSDALARHRVHWDDWENLSYYRRAYLKLCSELDNTKAADG